MRKLLGAGFALALFCTPALAQTTNSTPLLPISNFGPGTPFYSSSGASARSDASRWSDIINPRDYCSVCGDGSLHTVSATLGVTTLAGLASYTANGQTPFAFANQYPFGVLFNLVPEVSATTGATTLTFKSTATIGTQLPVTTSIASGSTTMQVGDLAVTSELTALANGTLLGGTGIQAGTTATSVPTTLQGIHTFSISAATTANLTTASYIIAYVAPAAGNYTLPVLSAAMQIGDKVTDTGGCIAANTQVDFVNRGKGEIRLSIMTVAQCPAQDVLTFIPSALSKVAAGETFQGPTGAVAANTTVSSVNQTTGVVTISAATNGGVASDSVLLNNASPTTGQQVTFYRPFTDAETAASSMDGYALQASVNKAATALYSSAVELPNASSWQTSFPIILPLTDINVGANQPVTTIGGRPFGFLPAIIEPTTDFGPGNAVISCGDPTAKKSNARGLYAASSVVWCNGRLHDLMIRPPSIGFNFVQGLRPIWFGVGPVQMDGVKEGNRLDWDSVQVQGFVCGARAVMDHTNIFHVKSYSNLHGWCMDSDQTDLFGDDHFFDTWLAGNSQAGLDIAPDGVFSGTIDGNSYLSTNPYSVFCEPGATGVAGICLEQVTMKKNNSENIGCAYVQDGGIQDGFTATTGGAARSISDVTEQTDLVSGPISGFGSPVPAGGCQWHAYYDMGYVNDLKVLGVFPIDYPPQAAAWAFLVRAQRIDAFSSTGLGGVDFEGEGVATVVGNARTFNENLVTGPFGAFGGFYFTGSWRWVTLKTPVWTAHLFPFIDSAATSLQLGALLEWSTATNDGYIGVQRAGKTPGAAFTGVNLQNWSTNNPNNSLLPVATSGAVVPIYTTGAATAGEMVIPDTANLGQAVSTPAISAGISRSISGLSTLSRTASASAVLLCSTCNAVPGDIITVSGATVGTYNGSWVVTASVANTSITFTTGTNTTDVATGENVSAFGSNPAVGLFYTAGSAGLNYGQLLQGRY